jgi:basic membrane protein A
MFDSNFCADRRRALQLLSGAAVVAALPGFSRSAVAADKLVVGVIYVGPRDDYA